MTKPPSFQFYPKDFLEGTAHMSNAEVGAYMRLLCHQWLKDGLDNDMAILKRFCAGDEQGIEVALMKFKKDKKGTLKNTRLENERKKQKNFKKSQSERGKKGAEGRWHNGHKINGLHASAILPAIGQASVKQWRENDSSSSSSTTVEKDRQKKIFEIMRTSTSPAEYSDDYLQKKSNEVAASYYGKSIKSLPGLISKILSDLPPNLKAKKMEL